LDSETTAEVSSERRTKRRKRERLRSEQGETRRRRRSRRSRRIRRSEPVTNHTSPTRQRGFTLAGASGLIIRRTVQKPLFRFAIVPHSSRQTKKPTAIQRFGSARSVHFIHLTAASCWNGPSFSALGTSPTT